MKRLHTILGLPLLFICGMAHAQPATGLRAEVFGGFDATSLDHEMPIGALSGAGPMPGIWMGPVPLDGTGLTYGVGIGYDVAVGSRFSVGIDGEYSDASTKMYQDPVRNSTVVIQNPSNAQVQARRDLALGRDLYIGGRITLPVSRIFNAYVKVGYTNLRVNDTQTVSILRLPTGPLSPFLTPFAPQVIATTVVRNVDGVRFGVGGQMAVRGRLYTMLEYRLSTYSADISRNQVIAGVGLRF